MISYLILSALAFILWKILLDSSSFTYAMELMPEPIGLLGNDSGTSSSSIFTFNELSYSFNII